MTTANIPVAELGEQARTAQARPGYVLATIIGAVFFAIGWAFGGLWRGAVFCALAARYGYWKGLGLTDESIAARTAPPAQKQDR